MRLKKIEGINIIPFIDIMLVLLVIVLMEATFVRTDALTLPQSSADNAAPSGTAALSFSITKDGQLLFEGQAIGFDEVASKLATIDKNAPIHILGDSQSRLQEFVTLLGMLQNLQMSNLSIITETKQ
ncbi:MAG: biopolymer transporter ExbD [Helicobacter sp.]|nr:biopolymer transporter ExbD [Helicobacter sp.]